jgi:hypothetical protein
VAVAVAANYKDFDYGLESPDGSPWVIDGEEFQTNPKYLLDSNDFLMIDIWRHYRSDMAGSRILPEAGGYMDQIHIMMQAFKYMDSVYERLKPKGR